jgi:hypothetical protein
VIPGVETLTFVAPAIGVTAVTVGGVGGGGAASVIKLHG